MMNLDPDSPLRSAADRFDEWFRYPLPPALADPRFEVRRAHPSEFERIYALVDNTFGVQRPRALYDWLYCRNPSGLAHCWVVAQREHGDFVGNVTSYPWPCACGSRRLAATLSGDALVVSARRPPPSPRGLRSSCTARFVARWSRCGASTQPSIC